MDIENVFQNLYNARTIINDGNNKKGMFLSGERCSACVRWIDEALLILHKQMKSEQNKSDQ